MTAFSMDNEQIHEEIKKTRKNCDAVTGNITGNISELRNKVVDFQIKLEEEFKKLQQQIDRQEQRIDQIQKVKLEMMETIKNITAISKSHNKRIKVLEEPKVIYKEPEPKLSFISRLFKI